MRAVAGNYAPPRFIENGYALLFALLPWSVEYNFGRWNLMVPSEPLLFIIGLGLAFELVRRSTGFLKSGKPVIAGALWYTFWIVWMGIAVVFSSMKTVSLKYWLVEAGHIWVFGFGVLFWPTLWRRALPCFLLSMMGVVVYTMVQHSMYDFRADQALLAPMPFFSDHTIYAAVLAILVFYGIREREGNSVFARFFQKKWIKTGLFLFLTAAIYISTSRAALLSMGVTAAVLGIYYCWETNKRLAIPVLITVIFTLSIGGIKVWDTSADDVSLRERLNRWDCAASMLEARPLTGFGPGTYQFQYLPFQKAEKMTRISVREPLAGRGPDTYGRGGGAHTEYWQAGAELGWPGLVLWLALVCGSLWHGLNMAVRGHERAMRYQVLLTSLGLLTFFIHALVNNFLHDARIAALVWGGVAYLAHFGLNRSAIHQ